MSNAECMILVSNEFINWYNQLDNAEDEQVKDVKRYYMKSGVAAKGHIYGTNRLLPLLDRVSEHVGKRICTFKGRKIKLRISGTVSETSDKSLFLSEDVISEILSVILEVINLKYGKNKR